MNELNNCVTLIAIATELTVVQLVVVGYITKTSKLC